MLCVGITVYIWNERIDINDRLFLRGAYKSEAIGLFIRIASKEETIYNDHG